MTVHADHHFSVTIHTDDLALVGCLRALSKFNQKSGNNQIPWGGTKAADWKHGPNQSYTEGRTLSSFQNNDIQAENIVSHLLILDYSLDSRT